MFRREVALNCDLIESLDARPDTTIRLVTGQSLVVREDVAQVIERIRAWRVGLLRDAGAPALAGQPLVPLLTSEVREALARCVAPAEVPA